MKFKHLFETDQYDLYPVISDVAKLGKLFQKDGEIEWKNSEGTKFRTYHDGSLHRYLKDVFDLYQILDDEDEFDEKLVNKSKYTFHFPEGLKGPK